jgi:hypothetical protein
MVSLLGLDPANYQVSALHRPDRTFPETNCYTDLWIELLHAHDLPPESAMAFACMVDFEGDQWTFFKPPPEDLMRMFGIDVHEMQLYRPTVDHVVEQLNAGHTMTIEADSFYLPDTCTTAYRRAHVKSSIAVEAINPETERLRYFHGPGYYELSGDDYRGVFRLGRGFSADVLPPYVELIRFDAGPRLVGGGLRLEAHEALQRQFAFKPRRNPWLTFGERLAQDLPRLLSGSGEDYHAYAFATVRQCGAAFEVARSFVQWLAPRSATSITDALSRQVLGAKTLLFKLARRRAFDPSRAIEELAADWNVAMDGLQRLRITAEETAA